MKVLTSGLERRTAQPFEASGKLRHEARVPWWTEYRDDALCVFGHYSFVQDHPEFLRELPVPTGRTLCIDYGIGKRAAERQEPLPDGRFRTRLAALRLPERVLLFDDGHSEPLPRVN